MYLKRLFPLLKMLALMFVFGMMISAFVSVSDIDTSKSYVDDLGLFRCVMYVIFITGWYFFAPFIIRKTGQRKLQQVQGHPDLTQERIDTFNNETESTAIQSISKATFIKLVGFITIFEIVVIRQFMF